MSWVNPPQYAAWPTVHAASHSWQGQWPPTAPAPYPGPPPVPAGVNPQAWTSGQWQLNPMFRGAMAGTQAAFQAWAPHPSWGAPMANAHGGAGANFNPYKRVPNPGNAEYWNTKLKENGLGLENMHIREEAPKKTQDNGVTHTPWVWVPKELCESPEHHDSSTLPNGQGGPEKHGSSQSSQNSAVRTQSQPHERSSTTSDAYRQVRPSQEPVDVYSSSSATRDKRPSAGQSHQRRDSAPAQQPDPRVRAEANVVPDRVVPPAVSSYSTYSQQQQQPQQQQQQQHYQQQSQPHHRQPSSDVSSREHQQARDLRTSPNRSVPSATSSASAAAAAANGTNASMNLAAPAPRPSALEAFSSKQDLQTTFSPGIIRTPNHYSSASTGSTPARRSTSEGIQSSSTTPSRRTSTDDANGLSTTPLRRSTGDDAYSFSSTPTRRSSYDDAGRTPSRPSISPQSHGPIYGPPSNAPSRSNSLSKRQSSTSTIPSTSSDTASAPTLPFLANFTEEPAGLLSPLVAPTRTSNGSSPKERELTRHHTYPSFPGFETIPEDRATHPRTPRPPDRDQGRDPNATPYASARSPPRSSRVSPDTAPRQISRSQTYPLLDAPASSRASTTPSRSPNTSTPSRSPNTSTPSRSPNTTSRSRGPSPSRTTRVSHNPLPQPPMPSYYPTASVSASASASSSYPTSSTSVSSSSASMPVVPPVSHRKTRTGFWNRRGDHLIMERNGQFIVYAPRNLANPPELGHYPSPVEGFMDQFGKKVRYDPTVPELPDSLPSHGEPPTRPYEHFVQYV